MAQEAASLSDAPRRPMSVARFHALQGCNYVVATAYVVYAAMMRERAKPVVVGAIMNSLVFDAFDATCLALWVYIFSCVHCIGWSYAFTTHDAYTHYATASQLAFVAMYGLRLMMKMPNVSVGLLMVSVDGLGALGKLYLIHVSDLGVIDVPPEKRVKYFKIPKPRGVSSQFLMHERLSMFFSVLYVSAAVIVLEFGKRFSFLATYQNPNTIGLLSAGLFVTGILSHSWIPALRQGQLSAMLVLLASKTALAFVLESYMELPPWFKFSINVTHFFAMTIALTNAVFHLTLGGPLFVGPTRIGFHHFEASLQSIGLVFVLLSLLYTTVWHQCITTAVSMPHWGRVQLPHFDLKTPILRPISRYLATLSVPMLRFTFDEKLPLLRGSAELATTSMMTNCIALHVLASLSMALIRTSAFSKTRMRGAAKKVFGLIVTAISYSFCDRFLATVSMPNPWTSNIKTMPIEFVGVAFSIWLAMALGFFIFVRSAIQLAKVPTSVGDASQFARLHGMWRTVVLKHFMLKRRAEMCAWLNGVLVIALMLPLILRSNGLPHPLPFLRAYLIKPKPVLGMSELSPLLFLLAAQSLTNPSLSAGSLLNTLMFTHHTLTAWFVVFTLYHRTLVGRTDIISRNIVRALLGCPLKGCDAKRFESGYLEKVSIELHIIMLCFVRLRMSLQHIYLMGKMKPGASMKPRVHVLHRTTMMMCILSTMSCSWFILIKSARILAEGTLFATTFNVLLPQLKTLSMDGSAESVIQDLFNIAYFNVLALAWSHSLTANGESAFGRSLKSVMSACDAVFGIRMFEMISRILWLSGYKKNRLAQGALVSLVGWIYISCHFSSATFRLIDSTKNRIQALSGRGHLVRAAAAAISGRALTTLDIASFKKKFSKERSALRAQPYLERSGEAPATADWENRWVECYKAAFGDETFEKNINSEFPIPMPPPNAFGLLMMQMKTTLMFVFGVLMQRRRPTHPVGVGAIGQFVVLENSKVPKNAFFTKGKTMPIVLRHSNAVGVKLADSDQFDDAALEIRGCALKFSHAEDDSPFDLHLNTGELAGFFNLESFLPFVLQMATFNDAAYKEWGRRFPTGIKAGIGGVRRAPDSYCDLYYYSQTCREFHALDGKRRYCKFRLVPYGAGPGTDVAQEPCLPNESDQHLIATTHMMKYCRLPNERRAPDYLREEFRHRIASENVRYRLQIQLYEATPSDTAEVFNPNKAWGTEFLDIGIVTLHAALPQHVIENTSFGIGRTPACMPLTQPINAQDYNALNWTRAAVYQMSSKIRRIFTRKRHRYYSIEETVKYNIKTTTNSVAGSGINSDVSIQLVGTLSATSNIVLFNDGFNFAAGMVSKHIARDGNIGEPAYAIISHGAKKSWNCGRIDVSFTSNGTVTTFALNVWRYINPGVRFVVPCSVTPNTSSACRRMITDATEQYLSFMKKEFDWSNGSYLPNHSTYSDHALLPITEQFSSTKYKDFFVDTFVGFENKGIADMIKNEDIKTLDDFYRLYATLPPVAITRDWRSDEEYGRQFMNGTHPNQIRKISQIPAKFRVTEADVSGVLPTGRTLASELAAGHIFMVDYEILEDIKRGEGYFVESSMALFFADENTALRPICIQHFQSGDDAPVWTPKDGEYEWLLAKAHLVCSDGNVHQMISHLFGTHLLMEPWSVCVERTLPRNHPVYRVLRPHLIYVIAINTLGRSLLIAPGGVTDRVVAVGQGGHMDLMSKAYQRFKLDDLNVPKSFKRRGVLNEATLKGYHHRDDALLAWACLRRFADSIFRQHYARDADVVEDIYVQNMIGEMQRFGYQGAHEDQHGVPSSIDSIEQLVDICTSVMYTCSFTHAAVNFSQWDYYSYVPNRPLIMRKPAPKAKVQITEEDLISALPSVKQGAQTMATGWTLSRFSKEEVYVGHYLADMMVTHGEIAALQELRSDLNAMAQTIDKRNAKLGIKAYPYMHPARVPSNIGV